MFFAALTSRSCSLPHAGQVQCRLCSGKVSSTCPHAEHCLLLGNHRSIFTTETPDASAFDAISLIAVPIDASDKERARLWF
jgi:hypothetical protein